MITFYHNKQSWSWIKAAPRTIKAEIEVKAGEDVAEAIQKYITGIK